MMIHDWEDFIKIIRKGLTARQPLLTVLVKRRTRERLES